MQSPTFPQCVYLGEFQSEQHDAARQLPAYLPADQGGFCLRYQQGKEKIANGLVENTVLCLLEDIPAKLLHINIFDFSDRPNFPFLNKLKSEGLCKVALNEAAAMSLFEEMEGLVQHRCHELLDSDETHLNQYNSRSTEPESFHVLIMHTNSFPSVSLSPHRFVNFLKAAYDAGIYIIALHDSRLYNSDPHHKNPALDELLYILPKMRMTEKTLMMDEKTLPIQKLAQFGLHFTPAVVDQHQIIDVLRLQLHRKTRSKLTGHRIVDLVNNPNAQRFAKLNKLLAKSKAKLQTLDIYDQTLDDAPNWLASLTTSES